MSKKIKDIEKRLKKWEDSLAAGMPIDFKDWNENSKEEWPEVVVALIVNLRKDRDMAWEMINKISKKNKELEAQNNDLIAVVKQISNTERHDHGLIPLDIRAMANKALNKKLFNSPKVQ